MLAGNPVDPSIIHTPKVCKAELTSSYKESKAGLLLAFDRAGANYPTERITICSDVQSFLGAVQGGAHDTQYVRQQLDNGKAHFPRRCSLPRRCQTCESCLARGRVALNT